MKPPTKQDPLTSPLFYCRTLGDSPSSVWLTNEEANHAIKSRRLRIGHGVYLTDGNGRLAEGSIAEIIARPVQVLITVDQIQSLPPPDITLTLASALPKGERQGTMLDMATQLGMSAFIPLNCAFSAVRFQDKMIDRWNRIILSACKQCRQVYLPEIRAARDLRSLIKNLGAQSLVIYGHQSGASIHGVVSKITGSTKEIVVVIGPEGGFDRFELELLAEHDQSIAVSLGSHVLRTETAGVALLGATTGILPTALSEQ